MYNSLSNEEILYFHIEIILRKSLVVKMEHSVVILTTLVVILITLVVKIAPLVVIVK